MLITIKRNCYSFTLSLEETSEGWVVTNYGSNRQYGYFEDPKHAFSWATDALIQLSIASLGEGLALVANKYFKGYELSRYNKSEVKL